jgi:hypothetical protein
VGTHRGVIDRSRSRAVVPSGRPDLSMSRPYEGRCADALGDRAPGENGPRPSWGQPSASSRPARPPIQHLCVCGSSSR